MRGHNIRAERSKLFLPNLLKSTRQPKSTSQFHSPHLNNSLFLSTTFPFSAKSPTYHNACKLFDEIPHPNSAQWQQHGSPPPNRFALPSILKSCSSLRTPLPGKSVHGFVVKCPYEARTDVFVGAALVEMYAKFGEMGYALRVFQGFPDPDVGLWTSVVSGHLRNRDADAAVSFFSTMVMERGASPNAVTLTCLISAVGHLRNLRVGKCCHGFVVRWRFDWDVALVNSLLNMYAKMGALDYARELFDTMPKRDVITWSCMVASYAHNEMADEALEVYRRMVAAGFEPNHVTIISALQACALAANLEEGRRIHKVVVCEGITSQLAVSTSLVDMYMKCGHCEEALSVFHQLPKTDVVVWGALIGGYAQNGLANEALEAFLTLLSGGTRPDAVTMVKALQACSQLGILCQAVCLHGLMVSSGFNEQVYVGAALIDLYSKCGSLDNAVQVFHAIRDKDVVIWSSMISGYGIHGLGRTAIAMFEHMIESSVKPNNVTFVAILSACSHTGLVEDGRRIFDEMISIYGIEPDFEHYTIIVDLLGRAGQLQEAMELIKQMPRPAGSHTWCALLAGCRIHNNIKMGLLAARNLLKLDAKHSGYHLLLSNIYAFDEKWDDAAKIGSLVKKQALRKVQGYSSVEVDDGVCSFLSNERSHKQLDRIQQVLMELQVNIREEGC